MKIVNASLKSGELVFKTSQPIKNISDQKLAVAIIINGVVEIPLKF